MAKAKKVKRARPRDAAPAANNPVSFALAFRLTDGARVGLTETVGRSDYDRQLDDWTADELRTAIQSGTVDNRYLVIQGTAHFAGGFFSDEVAEQIQVSLRETIRTALRVGFAVPPTHRTDFGACALEVRVLSSYEDLSKYLNWDRSDVKGEDADNDTGAARPAIRLMEITRAEVQADRLQDAGVRLVQQVLDRFAGRRGDSPQDSKDLADRTRKLAQRFGLTLFYEGRPAYLVWNKGVFVASSTDSSREHLGSSPDFLALIARPKGAAPEVQAPASGASSHAEKVRKRPPPRGRGQG
jgi:hypothetical protein